MRTKYRSIFLAAFVLAGWGAVVVLAQGGTVMPPNPSVSHGLMALPGKLAQGGWTVLVQLLLSVVAGAYAIERFIRLRQKNIVPSGLASQADSLWKKKKYEDILKLCQSQPSTLARVIRFIVVHRKNSFNQLSSSANDIASREMKLHIQKAYPLAVIGTLEPLLGLLGTVLGMMQTFALVSEAGALGNASLLAGGISKFLVCTGTGLFIAVPCLAVYHYLKLRGISLAHQLEEEVETLQHGWFLIQESYDEDKP